MGILGDAIGGIASIGAGIFGGASASKAARRVKKNLQQQLASNQDWYNKNYNEDATQRADAQRILAITEEAYKNRNRAAEGRAAVMGGTDESVAAAREANAQALADAIGKIAVAGENRKDRIENQYQATKANLNAQLNANELKKAQAITQAASGVADAAGNFAANLPY